MRASGAVIADRGTYASPEAANERSPNGVRPDQELPDTQRFASGAVYLRYPSKSRDHHAGIPQAGRCARLATPP